MDNSNNPPPADVKYNKLATEYSKVRAQANVLKRALLEEQNKSSCIRETLRLRESSLRRAEQEVDSLGFRNKQLEHRVASLQEDLDRDNKKPQKNSKNNNKSNSKNNTTTEPSITITDPVFTEELQKKIIENAQLFSLVADKNAEIQMMADRITELEERMSKKILDHTDIEKKLRKDVDHLLVKNAALETRLVDGASIIGSDDTLSVSESDHHTPMHHIVHPHAHHQHTHNEQQPPSVGGSSSVASSSNDEKLAQLEKELFQLRTKLEFSNICDMSEEALDKKSTELNALNNGPQTKSSAPKAAGKGTTTTDGGSDDTQSVTKDQLLYTHFSKKLDALFTEKAIAESKVITYITECESLQTHLELLNGEMADNDRRYMESQRNLQISDEDLATTRINYEEQISVLTEQVINLSDQLAALSLIHI